MKTHVRRAGLLFLLLLAWTWSHAQDSLSLSTALSLTLRNNPIIQKARKEVEAVDARVLQAGRIPNPTLGIAWNESPSVSRPGDANERDIRLSQAIEFPTKRGRRLDMASSEAQIQRLRFERTLVQVRSTTIQAYHRLLFSQRMREQLDLQWTLVRDLEQLVAARYRAGANSYLDLVRAKIEATRLGNDIVEARRERDTRRRELLLLIGGESDAVVTLTDDFPPAMDIENTDSAAQSLKAGSILLKIAQEVEQRQQHGLALAENSYLPDFEIGLARQRRGSAGKLWGVELQASIPLWFWQEPKGQVQEAKALGDIAALDRIALARRVHTSVRVALGSLAAARSQLSAFDRTLLTDARDIVSTALSQFENSQMDILNLLEIYRTYRTTHVEYLRATYNHAAAMTALETAAELPLDGTFALGDQ